MQKIVNPAFKAPPPRNPIPLQQPEFFRRELKSWDAIHLEHELSPDAQRKARHWLMKADHPEHLHTSLCRIYRVKIRPGMFELDENGTIAPPEKTPSQAIVFSLSEYVDLPSYVEAGGQSGVNKISGDYYNEGIYSKHIGRFEYDERGNIVNSEHMEIRNMFWIPYSPSKIRELLSTYEHDPTLSLAVCVASEGGSNWIVDTPKTIHNIDEFCDIEDIDGLIAANIGNASVPGK